MNDFNKNNRFGGSSDRRGFGRPSGRGFGRPLEMFQATCASCGKSCEVPFRPNGKKPVYCRECFAKNGGPSNMPPQGSQGPQGSNDHFAPKRDFDRPSSRRPEFKTEFKTEFKPQFSQEGDRTLIDIKQRLEAMNAKLESIMQTIGASAPSLKQVDSSVDTILPQVKSKKYSGKKFSKGKKK